MTIAIMLSRRRSAKFPCHFPARRPERRRKSIANYLMERTFSPWIGSRFAVDSIFSLLSGRFPLVRRLWPSRFGRQRHQDRLDVAAGPETGLAYKPPNGMFQQIHAAVQEAWSASDLGRLRRLMTPEMLSYFSEELTRNASQGTQNIVADVELIKGDLSESWDEGDLQYATAYMRWRALDYVVRLGRSPGDPEAAANM
jgi:hypothetical protein